MADFDVTRAAYQGDIVEQLRTLEKREAGNCYSVNKAMLDAAAEIERLRTALEARSARIAELEGSLQSEPVAWMVEMDGTVHFSVNDPRDHEGAFDNCGITPLYTRRSSHDAA